MPRFGVVVPVSATEKAKADSEAARRRAERKAQAMAAAKAAANAARKNALAASKGIKLGRLLEAALGR